MDLSRGLLALDQTSGMAEVEEKMEGIGWGLDELAEMLVEGSSRIVTGVDEKGPYPNLMRDAHGASDRIDHEAPAESPVVLGRVDREARQQEAGHLGWDAPLGEFARHVGLSSPGRSERVVADNSRSTAGRHEHAGVA